MAQATRPAGFYRHDEGHHDALVCDGIRLADIAAVEGTPLYVYSAAVLRERYQAIDGAFEGYPHAVHYALKANSTLAIARLLRELGSSVDANSVWEIEVARRAGFEPSQIVFTGVGKTPDELEAAAALGVKAVNVESAGELARLEAIGARLGRAVRVAVRVNPDIDAKSHPHISTGLKINKFGVPLDDARALLQTMKTRAQATVGELTAELARTRAKLQPADVARLESLIEDAQSVTLSDETIAQTLDAVDLASIGAGPGLKVIGLLIKEKYYLDHAMNEAQQECFNGFGALDLPRASNGYKPRPLEGVWATAPFLHNGSVPTIYDLLSPAYERPSEFYLGRREFDPIKIGFVTDRGASKRGFLFKTRIQGNHNTGHEFRAGYNETAAAAGDYQYGVIGPALTVDERFAIIEYLKVRRDTAPPPTGLTDCFALLKDPTP